MSAGIAWTYVHLIHNVVTFYFLHWKKGTPVWDDQGKYKDLTFWEQVDGGSQFTRNKKMFTIIPVALFLIATNSCDFKKQPIFLNAASVSDAQADNCFGSARRRDPSFEPPRRPSFPDRFTDHVGMWCCDRKSPPPTAHTFAACCCPHRQASANAQSEALGHQQVTLYIQHKQTKYPDRFHVLLAFTPHVRPHHATPRHSNAISSPPSVFLAMVDSHTRAA